jgi:2'-hydroxyisoflavone reductase
LTAETLRDRADLYVLISSVSVYSDFSAAGVDETSPLAVLADDELREATAVDASGAVSAVTYGKAYGGLKVLCEQAAQEGFPGRALIIRPGVIVGAHDYTDRLTYWVVRVARGGEVLAPAPPHQGVQFIDVRDLARWIVDSFERAQTGVYNATGRPVEMHTLLETCRSVTASNAPFMWVSEQFLIDQQVAPWTEIPLWLPLDALPHRRGFMAVNAEKAFAAGLNDRPLEETIADVYRWYSQNESGRELRAGLTVDRERRLLEQWHSHRSLAM